MTTSKTSKTSIDNMDFSTVVIESTALDYHDAMRDARSEIKVVKAENGGFMIRVCRTSRCYFRHGSQSMTTEIFTLKKKFHTTGQANRVALKIAQKNRIELKHWHAAML